MQKVRTVSQITKYIKDMFVQDNTLRLLYVKGEVSNCKYHSSGHIYFTIKDRSSQLSCVMFASYVKRLDFRLQEGQNVVVEGNIDVFVRDGKYQMYATDIKQEGAGQLYEEYEKLKKRLFAEGLFDENRKKPIPKYARKIGVVTAETGAVIQDICNVSHRRNPYVQILLYPAKVQGKDAHRTIIEGIRYFEQTDVDTIIIGRGGGSIEDLWEFNQEVLAYAIFECTKPVISAVGHETDTTIADYVSDSRAPTPSAAAEIAVFSYHEYEVRVQEYTYKISRQMENMLQFYKMQIKQYETSLGRVSPKNLIQQKRMLAVDYANRLQYMMEQKLTSAKHQMALYAKELQGLSPLQKLQDGYSYVSDLQGNNIRTVEGLTEGQQLRLSMADGQVTATVDEVEKQRELESNEKIAES